MTFVRELMMRSMLSTGRAIGMLLPVQLAGFIVPFVLLLPITTGPRSYLANAAAASLQIKAAVLLLLANGALTIGVSLLAFRVIRRFSEPTALGLVAASVIMCVLQAVDNVHVLTMLSLSQQVARSGGPEDLFLALAAPVGATRMWAHTTELLAIDAWIVLLHAALYRFALVPRALTAFGLVTAALHATGIPLRGLLGYSPEALMGAPMGLSHLALAVRLSIKGFDDRPPSSTDVEAVAERAD